METIFGTRNRMTAKFCLATGVGLLALALTGSAMSPTALRQELAKGSTVTVIDVRSTDLYGQAHIPGAINIPAALCEAKKLPPLGRVVVYDGGLGVSLAGTAANTLNAKHGIQAEVLVGGFAAWEATTRETTRGKGVERELLPMATYQEVKTNFTDDLVLVDLRKSTAKAAGANGANLLKEFPQARVTSSPFLVKGAKDGSAPLLVLIDSGDGSAENTARALRANGVTRFVILAGGDAILQRQGQSGLKRSGTTINAPFVSPQPSGAQ